MDPVWIWLFLLYSFIGTLAIELNINNYHVRVCLSTEQSQGRAFRPLTSLTGSMQRKAPGLYLMQPL